MKFRRKAVMVLFPATLYFMGLSHWIFFFDFGEIPMDSYDWQSVRVFLGVLRESLCTGRLPFHISEPLSYTTRFMAIPPLNLTPAILLLPFLSDGWFVVFDVILLYSVGFIGSFYLKRAAGWSAAPFVVFYLLFNYNGFITAHLSVGHLEWGAYFLLPWFFLFVLRWVKKEPDAALIAVQALAIFAMTMQGFVHLALWCLGFMILVSLRSIRRIKAAVWLLGTWALLSMVKLWPATLAYFGVKRAFWGGFQSWRDLLAGFLVIRLPHLPYFEEGIRKEAFRLGWWEYDFYIGIFGLAFIIYFGIWLRISARRRFAGLRFPEFDLPVALLAVLSLGNVYEVFYRIPLLSFERATSRLILLPLLALTLVACMRLNAWLLFRRGRNLKTWLIWSGTVLTAIFLAIHSVRWAVSHTIPVLLPEAAVPDVAIVERYDPIYRLAIFGGAATSCVSLLAAAWYAFRRRRNFRETIFGSLKINYSAPGSRP